MMPSIAVGSLTFDFPNGWRVDQLDEWAYYRNQFQGLGNNVRMACSRCSAELRCQGCEMARTASMKCCDLVAVHGATAWLIEVKDYRQNRRTKAIDLPDEIALKARDSVAVLLGAKMRANDDAERELAGQAVGCQALRLVLHLEQPVTGSKLFPRAIDPSKVLQRLKQLVKALDPHPAVAEVNEMRGLPWTVR
jgi:hypothetical protein